MKKLSLVGALLIAVALGAVMAAVFQELQRSDVELIPVELDGSSVTEQPGNNPSALSDADGSPHSDNAGHDVESPSSSTTTSTLLIVPQPTFRPPVIASREEVDG